WTARVIQLHREQIETLATKAPARTPAPGTAKREAGPPAGDCRAESQQPDARGRRRSGSRRYSAGPAAAPGLADRRRNRDRDRVSLPPVRGPGRTAPPLPVF